MGSFDFLSCWEEYTDPLPAPLILRRWAGIGVLSAILSRRVWLRPNSRLPQLFPNVYILLLSPPAGGKDISINAARRLIYAVNDRGKKTGVGKVVAFGGESISPKGLLDRLNDPASHYTLHTQSQIIDYHSLAFFVPEATTAMPEYNQHLIGILNDLYNCNEEFTETIRGISYTIPNPHLMLLLGNQPDTFYRVFPDSTFQMGFTSRLFLIYSAAPRVTKLYLEAEEEQDLDTSLWGKMVEHCLDLHNWNGQLETTKEMRIAANLFSEKKPGEVPGRRFKHWNSRRTLNCQKLTMCIAASEGEKTLTLSHWERAINYLFEAEAVMPKIFSTVTSDRGFIDDLDEVLKLADEEGEITERRILSSLARIRPPHEIRDIISLAIRAGILQQQYDQTGVPIKPTKYKVAPSETTIPPTSKRLQ